MTTDLRIARVHNPLLSTYWKYSVERLLPSTNYYKTYSLTPHVVENEFINITPKAAPAGLKIYEAPFIPEFYLAMKITIQRKNIKLYDIYNFNGSAIVSEKAKAIIEKEDSLIHQYYPIELLDRHGERRHEENYYFMFIRRFISLEGGDDVDPNFKPYRPTYKEQNEYYSALKKRPEYREFLQSICIWSQPIERDAFYLSNDFLASLCIQDCSGLDEENSKKDDTQGAPVIYV